MSRARYIAVEFSRSQGRDADNRPLLTTGEFGVDGQYSEADVAVFMSAYSAINTAMQASNARPDCTIETIPRESRQTTERMR